MTAVTIELELPDEIVEEARMAGLFSPEAIEAMLSRQLRKREIDALFEAADRLAAVDSPTMSEDAVQAEVDAVRAERRAGRFRHRRFISALLFGCPPRQLHDRPHIGEVTRYTSESRLGRMSLC